MEFLLVASAHFLALLSPGPDFFLIVQTALRLPLRYVIGLSAGIAAANAIYLGIAITSLEFIREIQELTITLKYLGAIYLVYLGIMLLKAPPAQEIEQSEELEVNGDVINHFIRGFLSGILNPKNIIFYFSIFTVMVSSETPFWVRCLYGLWMTSIVWLWDIIIGFFIGSKTTKKVLGKGIFYVEKFSGAMLVFFGLALSFG